jgi:hypothetical protein
MIHPIKKRRKTEKWSMLDNLNLNDIAEAYLSVNALDQPEYERLLIRSRGDAIFPLLRAILIMTAKRKNTVDSLAEQGRNSPVGEEWARELWAKGMIEPMLEASYDVVRRVGPLAQGILCGMLLHYEYKIRLAAALLLARNDSPDEKVQQLVQLTIALLQRKYKNQGIVVRVLGIVLLHIGVSEWKKIVEDDAQKMNVTVKEWIEQIRITALIELSK